MKIASLLACAIILSLNAAPLAFAETAKPAAPMPDAPMTGAPMTGAPMAAPDDAKAAKAKECIAEANAKGLHGKERKKFKHHCKHAK